MSIWRLCLAHLKGDWQELLCTICLDFIWNFHDIKKSWNFENNTYMTWSNNLYGNKQKKNTMLNLLPDDKIWGLPKLEAFADDKWNVTSNMKAAFHRIENIVGKEENAGYQHFLLFPQCFQNVFSSSASKGVIVWERVNKFCQNDTCLGINKLFTISNLSQHKQPCGKRPMKTHCRKVRKYW